MTVIKQFLEIKMIISNCDMIVMFFCNSHFYSVSKAHDISYKCDDIGYDETSAHN